MPRSCSGSGSQCSFIVINWTVMVARALSKQVELKVCNFEDVEAMLISRFSYQ